MKKTMCSFCVDKLNDIKLECNYASMKVQTKFYTTNVYLASDVAGAGTSSNGLILFNIKPSTGQLL